MTNGPYTIKAVFDPGLALGIAGGYNFGMFRVEGEIGYQLNDFDSVNAYGERTIAKGDISCLSFLANGYINFVNSSPLTPYISGGIGVARVEENDFGGGQMVTGKVWISEDDTVFAYQVGAGVAYDLTKNLTIDIKYRYFATAELGFGEVKATFANHNVYFGFRYNF